MAVIFTKGVMEEAATRRQGSERLLDRWATATGEASAIVREQLELAVALVPPALRPRILGRLADRDADRAASAAGELLLGLTLDDLGWEVEQEPRIEGCTPDLRIAKEGTEFVVEIKQIVGSYRLPELAAYQVLERALSGITIPAIITFTHARLDGRTSLKPLRRFVQEAACVAGNHVFDRDGVFVTFTVSPTDEEWPAYTGGVCCGWGGDHEPVQTAIDEKIHKYPVPLIVALDMVDCSRPFPTVDEVLYGREVVRIPISPETGSAAGPATLTRANDGIVVRRDHAAETARERMDAVAPFQWSVAADGIRLTARVLANPFRAALVDLQVFAPIPRFLVTSAEQRQAMMQLFGEIGSREEPRWFHRPGYGSGPANAEIG